jgi:hypothetical protein
VLGMYCDSQRTEAAYDKLYGARDDKALDFHEHRDDVCPESAGAADQHGPHWSTAEGFADPGSAARKVPSVQVSERDERRVTFDLLLFTLFGILLILIMEQFVNIGVSIGRSGGV